MFIRLSQAYELLSDEEKRFQYDGWIEDLEGGVPPFAEAYERFKDADKHPMFEIYDSLYNPATLAEHAPDDQPPPEPGASATDEHATPVQNEKSQKVLDVAIPDAVREALGMASEDRHPSAEEPPTRESPEN